FPGGKRDKEDKNLVDTAVRETVEELGIEQDKIDVWGPMTPFPDRRNKFVVTPVLSFLGEIDIESIPFNHDEVSEVFYLTLEHALAHRKYTVFTNGYTMPVFINGPHKVWGLSSSIMDLLFEIMFPGQYNMVLNYSSLQK
ncbi:hypothetical protein QZH41_015360, partial [Actinostola sp. cb2023]